MDGGHRDEDDPLGSPSRLAQRDQLNHPDHVAHPNRLDLAQPSAFDRPDHLDHSDRFDGRNAYHHRQPLHHHQCHDPHDPRDQLLPPPPLLFNAQPSLSSQVVVGPSGVSSSAAAAAVAPPDQPSSSLPFPLLPAQSDQSEPDDPRAFYRSYTNNNLACHQVNSLNAVAFTAADLMDPAPTASLRQPLLPSHASLSNDLAAEQPQAGHPQEQDLQPPSSLASRVSAMRTLRSFSSPVANGGAGSSISTSAASAGRPSYGAVALSASSSSSSSASVKDLKKRFDQINTAMTTTSVGAASSTTSSVGRSRQLVRQGQSSTSSSSVVPRPHAATNGSSSSATAASSAIARAKSPAGRAQQPQPVNSPHSFASRIAKPRNATPAGAPPTAGGDAAARMVLPTSRANGLLFGEVLPEQSHSIMTGYGIDAAVRPRRTSESHLHKPPRHFTRSRSEMDDHDPDSVSPADWYRSAAPPTSDVRGHTASRIPTHGRAHSDLAGSKQQSHGHRHPPYSRHGITSIPPPSHPHLIQLDTTQGLSRPSTSLSDKPPQSPTSPTSRLPISVRKLSEASAHSSPSSTRSNSPTSVAGRRAATSSKVSRQPPPLPQGSPPVVTNAKTPTKRTAASTSSAATRAKASAASATPSSSRKPPPSYIVTPNGSSGRLGTYITAPPPKMSPPLRSSRPRQPVSAATASVAASRLGRTSAASSSSSAAERPKMPYASSTRSSAARQDENRANRRKIDVGPIDFAQRRETIRLKYSKSIRETEAVAARQAAAERRKKELEAAAKAKALAEAAVRAQSEASRRALAPSSATLSTRSSVSSLSAAAATAAAMTVTTAASVFTSAAAITAAPSSRSSMTSVITNAEAVVAMASSSTPSQLPTTTTPPLPYTVSSTAAVASGSVSSPPRSTPELKRMESIRTKEVDQPALKISTSNLNSQSAPNQATKDDSPTLGIPGTFPDAASPPKAQATHQERPPSAVSVNSGITEFDVEPQTEPPLPESVPDLRHPADSWQNPHLQQPSHPELAHESVEYGSPFDPSTPEDERVTQQTAASQSDRPQGVRYVHGITVYQHAVEGHVMPMANETPVERSNATDVPPFEQYMPGSYRQDSFDSRPYTPRDSAATTRDPAQLTPLYQSPVRQEEPSQSLARQAMPSSEEEDNTVQLGDIPFRMEEPIADTFEKEVAIVSVVEQQDADSFEPALQSQLADSDYEVKPYLLDGQQTTTVTILARETDVSSRRPSLSRLNSGSSRGGDYYSGPSLKDNIALLRGSTLTVSDISDEPQQPSGESQHTPDTSNSLLLPSILSPANRSSQQSGWTDFSIESEDARAFIAARESVAGLPSRAAANGYRSDSRAREAPRTLQSLNNQRANANPYEFDSRPASTVDEDPSNQQRESYNTDNETSPNSPRAPMTSEQAGPVVLPELDTGSNFDVPYLSGKKGGLGSHVPLLPDHEPPPIPVSVDGRDSLTETSARPSSSSAYYDSSRPNSFALGTRDDNDGQDSFTFGNGSADDSVSTGNPPALTTQSSEKASFDLPRQSTGGATFVEDDRPGGTNGASDVSSANVHPYGGSPKKTAPSKEQTRLVQRQMVIRELVDTEAVFVRDMNIVEEIYKGTAEACPKLDSTTIKLIFRNTDEIIAFHAAFLTQLKDAVSAVYVPKGGRRSSPPPREDSIMSETGTLNSTSAASTNGTIGSASTATTAGASSMTDTEDARDRQTSIGPVFRRNIDQMRITHEAFLRSSDSAAKRLIQIQEDPTVKLWLTECNEVAQDLTAAWNLDSLLIKPMQRITKYPNLISQLLQHTPADHPDRSALMSARTVLENAILEINKTKKNFELVGQIVGRKHKDSDVRAGFARAFGKRVDKLQVSSNRPPEDPAYSKLHEKFGDDYLRLQVVLRDVEYYTRQVSAYVHEFLQLLSAMELVMRLQPSPYPELESKWAHFNVSMRDMEKVALEQHLAQVRKHVIEPFELVIKCYGNPNLAMKKRAKRRLDYERAVQLKKSGKKIDKQLAELVEQYEALNETLKKELPLLSANTEKIGNICLGNFVNIQVRWFAIWKEKVKVVLEGQQDIPEVVDIINTFSRDFRDMEEYIKKNLSILGKGATGRADDGPGSFSPGGTGMLRSRSGRPADLSPRVRGGSINSDSAPTLPTPDFGGRRSGQFVFTPGLPPAAAMAGATAASIASSSGLPSPHQFYYRSDYYTGPNTDNSHVRTGPASPIGPGPSVEVASRPIGSASGATNYYAGGASGASGTASGRPSTGRSYDSSGNMQRPSVDSTLSSNAMPLPSAGQSSMAAALQAHKRESASTSYSNNPYPSGSMAGDGGSIGSGSGGGGRRFSDLFHSALPVSDDTAAPTGSAGMVNYGGYTVADDASLQASHRPSRERAGTTSSNTSSNQGGGINSSGYNVLWLAASLFEFNIETKHEAGYPYLTYQAGEIFDVIAEKGELWLAKNQDDPSEVVGWIWSKHFAKLADS